MIYITCNVSMKIKKYAIEEKIYFCDFLIDGGTTEESSTYTDYTYSTISDETTSTNYHDWTDYGTDWTDYGTDYTDYGYTDYSTSTEPSGIYETLGLRRFFFHVNIPQIYASFIT